tara:strand:+ start:140 stop:364 length:225 start_codon:yes stop_codon:yes gene_type:complete
MQDQQIIQLIENLKGRRNYEEKKAAKLGFKSLYAYFENKIMKEKESFEEKKKELEKITSSKETIKKNKKSCSCC